jgi:hypothetical protein
MPRGAHGAFSLLGEASGKRDKMRTPQTPTKPPIVMHCHGSPHKPLVSLVGTIGLAIPRCLSRQLCLAAATRTARMHISTPCRSSCGSSFRIAPLLQQLGLNLRFSHTDLITTPNTRSPENILLHHSFVFSRPRCSTRHSQSTIAPSERHASDSPRPITHKPQVTLVLLTDHSVHLGKGRWPG